MKKYKHKKEIYEQFTITYKSLEELINCDQGISVHCRHINALLTEI